MKIFIQGRKDGYNVLYPTPTPTEFYQFACDIQRIDAENNARYYGKSLYSIAFTNGGCIFTKYVMGYDVLRSNLGSIGISFFIPNAQKIMGVDVKTLLDELVNTYCVNYCPDYYINNNRQEDWLLFTSLANRYDTKLRTVSADDAENLQSGTQDAAFVYYTTDDELQRYFDSPYQDEYSQFKQVFFVKSDLQGKSENPLNALRNSENNLTGKIDLENPKYKLLINGKGIDVKPCNVVRKKQSLTITYYEQEFYKTPDPITGTWNDIKQKHPNCVDVNDVEKTVVIKPITLESKRQTITISVKDRNGHTVSGTEIICKRNNYTPIKNINTNNEIIFEGEAIGQTWQISARNEKENMFSDEVSIIPKNQKDVLKLILKKRKRVVFEVVDEYNTKINNFEYWINDGNGYRQGGQHIFEGDDIEKHWNIDIRDKNGNSSDTIDYCPATGKNPLRITLKKRQKNNDNTFSFKNGEHGKLKGNDREKYKSNHIPACLSELINSGQCCEKKLSFSNFDIEAIPDFGYKFDRWEKQQKDGEYIITAQFKPILSVKQGIIATLILIAAIVATCIFRDDVPTQQVPPVNEQTVREYVEGDSLFIDKLNVYKTNWESQQPQTSEKGGGVLGVFGIGKKQTESTEYKEWDKVTQWINRAIEKRELINDKNFVELKNQRYSDGQQKFKDAVNKIDSTRYEDVSNQLGNVDELTLSQIAEKIQDLLNENDNPDSEIYAYLDGIELKKETLNQYKQQTTDENLKQRIDDCITFRGHLNKGEVTKLKNMNFAYSDKQQSLKEAMSKINENNKKYVGNKLNNANISTMNLDEIAEFIEDKIQEYNSTTNASESTVSQMSSETTPVASNVSKSDLEKEFFELIQRGDIQKENYDALYQKYKNQSNEIVTFLKEITKNSKDFKDKFKGKFDKIPNVDKKKINSLDQLEEKIK
jgi:hypothetical protein